MKYGYLRVSTAQQHTENQIPAITAAGVDPSNLITDHAVSGTTKGKDRPGWSSLLAKLQPGDEVVVYAVSRVGRGAQETQAMVFDLRDRGVTFRSATEPLTLDPTAPPSIARVLNDVFLAMLAGFAEMERIQMLERQAAGIATARARGRRLGRPAALDQADVAEVFRLATEGVSQREIARRLRTSKGSVQRALAGV
jgi:putative DNA-invertase from lambdoid prophage Rac